MVQSNQRSSIFLITVLGMPAIFFCTKCLARITRVKRRMDWIFAKRIPYQFYLIVCYSYENKRLSLSKRLLSIKRHRMDPEN